MKNEPPATWHGVAIQRFGSDHLVPLCECFPKAKGPGSLARSNLRAAEFTDVFGSAYAVAARVVIYEINTTNTPFERVALVVQDWKLADHARRPQRPRKRRSPQADPLGL